MSQNREYLLIYLAEIFITCGIKLMKEGHEQSNVKKFESGMEITFSMIEEIASRGYTVNITSKEPLVWHIEKIKVGE